MPESETSIEAQITRLVQQHEAELCTYLARLTGCPARARELAQETFLCAYQALLKGQQWDSARAWLFRVASRLATDDYHRRRLLDWLPLRERDPDPAEDVESEALERVTVQAALDRLPLRYRLPLLLYDQAGCSSAEVARILGLSHNCARRRLARARAMFRRAYTLEGGHS